MCMRTRMLDMGEKVFNVLVVIAFLAGAVSGVFAGLGIGGKEGIAAAVVQIFLSWSGTFIIALVVYALLDIRHSLSDAKQD